MTIQQLYTYFKDNKNATTLSTTTLGAESQRFIALLADIHSAELILKGQSPQWVENNQAFTVDATTTVLNITEAPVTLSIYQKDTSIQFRLQLSMQDDWTFGQSFSTLKGSIFNLYSFEQAFFIVSTEDIESEGLITGLNFKGNFKAGNKTLESLKSFIKDDSLAVLPMIGQITKKDDSQTIRLQTPLTDTGLSFDLTGLKFQFSKPIFVLAAHIYQESSYQTYEQIEDEVTLTGKENTNSVTLPLALTLPSFISGWMISLPTQEGIPLTNIIAFLGLLASTGLSKLESVFSDGILGDVTKILQKIHLKSFFIEIRGTLGTTKFHTLSFEIGSGHQWPIIENKLAISDLGLSLNLTNTATGCKAKGHLQGEIDIGEDIALNVYIPLFSSTDNWRLSSHRRIELSKGLNGLSNLIGHTGIESFLPASLSDMGGLALSEFSLSFNPITPEIKSLSFVIDTDHTWQLIPHQLEIQSLYIRFGLEHINQSWQFAGNISGVVEVSDAVTLDIQVQKYGHESDWHFYLHANRIPLPSIADLASLTGTLDTLEGALPESLATAELYLDEPQIEVNISQAKVESLGFDLLLDEDQVIKFSDQVKLKEANLNVDIDFGGEKQITLDSTLLLAGIDFRVEGRYVSSEGWNFEGHIAEYKDIPAGDFLNQLTTTFGIGALPNAIQQLTLSNIWISFNTQTKDFHFALETKFPLAADKDLELDAIIHIDITHNNEKYHRQLSGVVQIKDLEFDLIFDQEQNTETIFLAAYENHAGKAENIEALAELVTDNKDLLDVAEGITLDLRNALLVIDKGEDTKVFFGLSIGGGIDLTHLPLVGKFFTPDTAIKMDFQPFLTNKDFSDLSDIQTLVPTGGYQLPEKAKQRLGLNVQMQLDGAIIDFNEPLGIENNDNTSDLPTTNTTDTPSSTTTTDPTPSSDNIKWFKIQKQIGPIHFGRIGVKFEEGELYFLLDATLSAAGLTISLDELYVKSRLNPIHPQFGLHGLGVDFKNGPLEIGGALLRKTVTEGDYIYDTYNGQVIVHAEKFGLSALGSYAYYKGHPSMFVYAFLDAPIGGPPFFFVTGLALGFGYNRRIVVPSIEKVSKFPLVSQAMAGEASSDITTALEGIQSYIPPALNHYFLAVGVRFSSFKIIDSFALLIASFSPSFELNILGISTLVLPTPEEGKSVPPLAEIQLALKATFNPEKGFVKVRAVLTPASFILDRRCHLTGGLAFYTWFKDNTIESASAGDFVLTIGGYHPQFNIPAHYPKVAPVGFNWQVNSELLLKGAFYFALIPSAAMAGGHLEASWNSSSLPLKVVFNLGIDFIISWKPYFYQADAYVQMVVDYTYKLFGTHHISVDVGADLSIWGPDFSGKAHVHLWILDFEVNFGAATPSTPTSISWSEFKQSFLPEPEKWLNVSVAQGLVKETTDSNGAIAVINPKDFLLRTESVFPISEVNSEITKVNIGAMERIGEQGVETSHQISIEYGGSDVTSDFTYTPIKKNVPAALWGNKLSHGVNDETLVKDVCMGFEIKGKASVGGSAKSIDSKGLLNKDEPIYLDTINKDESKDTPLSWVTNQASGELEKQAAVRNNFLNKLGFQKDYYPKKDLIDQLVLTT